MIFEDIKPKKQKITNIVNYILNKKPEEKQLYGGTEGPYIKVYGEELMKKFNYDFLDTHIEVSVFYDRKPFTDPWKVREYYGDKLRIDVVALDDYGEEISKKQQKDYLTQAFNEYIDMINSAYNRYDYGSLD